MHKPKGGRRKSWNEHADMYNQIAFSELEDSRAYLDAIGVRKGDEVIDVCCGPGRMSVLAAERGARVVGIDSAEMMLAYARENAEAMGVADRCEFRLMDWDHVLPGQNLKPADVVMASRCGAIMQVEKLSALAKRTVGVQIFANAPSIPALLDVLFSGCEVQDREGRGGSGGQEGPDERKPPMGSGGPFGPGGPGPMGPGGPKGPLGPRPDGPEAKESIYLRIAQKAFEAGYDPNVRVFPERFRQSFANAEEAVAWVVALNPERAEGNMERLALNVAPFLADAGDGVEFCISTKAAIVWWDVT